VERLITCSCVSTGTRDDLRRRVRSRRTIDATDQRRKPIGAMFMEHEIRYINAFYDPRWYAVQSRPKQEDRAATNLAVMGLTTLVPKVRQPRSRGAGCGVAPLFPRYFFVYCRLASTLPKIRYARGVAKILGTSEGPTPIDDAIIEAIQSRIGPDGFVELV